MINKRYTTLKDALKFPLIFTGLIWALHIIKIAGHFDWNKYGIHPRESDGLIGIIAAPLLHSSFQHLFSNTIPLFLMMTLIGLFYTRVSKISFFAIYLLTGISVWFFGRPVYHIGASGVVYGLISFVFWSGVFRKNFRAIILSVVIVFLYSGYIAGVFPGKPGISWESHLLGALVGILVAFIVRDVEEPHERDDRIKESLSDDDYEESYFFDRDVFGNLNSD
ncbi:MAG TPA: rhomboid family intramembrane serine protease [Bacteroidetes bacterium]|nr:rhomboid family intramembrane serine protease [Bacteroidota bacterium]